MQPDVPARASCALAIGADSICAPAACAVGVMAKAPRPGYTKTRLCPPLSPCQAADLSAAFLRDITHNIAQAARQHPLAGYVAYAPAGAIHLLQDHLAQGTGLLLADGTPLMPPDVQGFGRCLLHAAMDLLGRGHACAILLNADSPTLPTQVLVRAAAALARPGDRVVLGPAEDGGYYLLGLKAAHAALFADIAWSTGSVTQATRQRAAALGVPVVELPVWYDVDDHATLTRVARDIAAPAPVDGLIPYPAPATAAVLRGLALDFGSLAAG
jgi:rSAM/selenodomain-associated transferase 1